jgi:hypothetical protein
MGAVLLALLRHSLHLPEGPGVEVEDDDGQNSKLFEARLGCRSMALLLLSSSLGLVSDRFCGITGPALSFEIGKTALMISIAFGAVSVALAPGNFLN